MIFDTDFSSLDNPQVLQFAFYPRQESSQTPPEATDYSIGVDAGVSIGCRFYIHSNVSPSILYFHGNGEIASDYDAIAPLYNEQGINLFVADYRGYGASGGTPSFTHMANDAVTIFHAFMDIIAANHYADNIFIMGRSLGSLPALELAHHYQQQIKGLIIESGFASIMRLLTHLGFPSELIGLQDTDFPNAAWIRSVNIPTLILHGEYDSLIPNSEAKELYSKSSATKKRLVIIDGAEHNDIMLAGMSRYFAEIADFISEEIAE